MTGEFEATGAHPVASLSIRTPGYAFEMADQSLMADAAQGLVDHRHTPIC